MGADAEDGNCVEVGAVGPVAVAATAATAPSDDWSPRRSWSRSRIEPVGDAARLRVSSDIPFAADIWTGIDGLRLTAGMDEPPIGGGRCCGGGDKGGGGGEPAKALGDWIGGEDAELASCCCCCWAAGRESGGYLILAARRNGLSFDRFES